VNNVIYYNVKICLCLASCRLFWKFFQCLLLNNSWFIIVENLPFLCQNQTCGFIWLIYIQVKLSFPITWFSIPGDQKNKLARNTVSILCQFYFRSPGIPSCTILILVEIYCWLLNRDYLFDIILIVLSCCRKWNYAFLNSEIDTSVVCKNVSNNKLMIRGGNFHFL